MVHIRIKKKSHGHVGHPRGEGSCLQPRGCPPADTLVWDSTLQMCEMIRFSCLSYLFCGTCFDGSPSKYNLPAKVGVLTKSYHREDVSRQGFGTVSQRPARSLLSPPGMWLLNLTPPLPWQGQLGTQTNLLFFMNLK